MTRTCVLAGIGDGNVAMLRLVVQNAGIPAPAVVARLNVTELGRLRPSLVVCDVDDLDVDPLEMLRQLRFVLPDCIVVVYTGVGGAPWTLACHLAGANCMLAKDSSKEELARGLRVALRFGCHTDPRLSAA